jgi:periplasmic protein TonB
MSILSQPNSGRRPRDKRKGPNPSAFQAVVLPSLPTPSFAGANAAWFSISVAFVFLILVAAFLLSPKAQPPVMENEIIVFEEEKPLPVPPLPEPEPPKPEPLPPPPPIPPPLEPPPPPQFGLQEEELSEASDLAVATGNTLQIAADTVTAPAPSPLPPAPIFIDQPPGILSGVAPEYPPRALDQGLEGTVTALITIDTLGRVTQVLVEKSAGTDFDHVVMASVRTTHFRPPVRQGRRVAAKFRRPYEFRLE